jgi:flagellar biosynthesis/type III secretory pathway protein FliH
MTSSSRHGSPAAPPGAPAAPASTPAIAAWTLDELPLYGGEVLGGRERAADQGVDDAAAERALQASLDEAYARGYSDGEGAARASSRAELQSAIAALRQALAAVAEGTDRWVDNAEEHICALAIGVAQQIIEREIATDVELVVELVRRALAEIPAEQPVAVRVNPVDLALLSEAEPDAPGAVTRRDLSWIGDPRIARGGCLVEGRDRVIDGRVDTALERLYRRLAGLGA